MSQQEPVSRRQRYSICFFSLFSLKFIHGYDELGKMIDLFFTKTVEKNRMVLGFFNVSLYFVIVDVFVSVNLIFIFYHYTSYHTTIFYLV